MILAQHPMQHVVDHNHNVDAQIRFFQPDNAAAVSQPKTLYQAAVRSSAQHFRRLRSLYHVLGPELMFDVYEAMFRQGRLCQVGYEWSELQVVAPLLKLRYRRPSFGTIFQAILDHGVDLVDILVSSFSETCDTFYHKPRDPKAVQKMVQLAFDLGIFLEESGWYADAEKCLRQCLLLVRRKAGCMDRLWLLRRQLDCQYWLLTVCTAYCEYGRATAALAECQTLMDAVEAAGGSVNRALVYSQCVLLQLHKGMYCQAMDYALKSLQALDHNSSVKTVIDVFRHASRALVLRRKLVAAGVLVRHAVKLTRRHFDDGRRLPAPLLDLAFYLLNIDLTASAARVYEIALNYTRMQLGDGNNLKVAQAHEDLAYALYIREYSTGEFNPAREHSERAMEIMKRILSDEHLLLASCSRVKALVLEEIAIDLQDKKSRQRLLCDSEQQHLHCLKLFTRALGEDNLQTAKHYANLGRLYQSDERYQEAEDMHRRAISIKEKLLGADDYEVALSLGHLASLYNYDLGRYEQAEALYLRSIEIGRKLFDGAYSSLEYDYRGLVHVYSSTQQHDKLSDYLAKLSQWHTLREQVVATTTKENLWEDLGGEPQPTADVLHSLNHLLKAD